MRQSHGYVDLLFWLARSFLPKDQLPNKTNKKCMPQIIIFFSFSTNPSFCSAKLESLKMNDLVLIYKALMRREIQSHKQLSYAGYFRSNWQVTRKVIYIMRSTILNYWMYSSWLLLSSYTIQTTAQFGWLKIYVIFNTHILNNFPAHQTLQTLHFLVKKIAKSLKAFCG